ncbi:MAG TPA: aldo/keto reductase [Cyclobacteriaceae bacterium]|nr:aldo/keto reductase [Cyclobacteriaceae bacterium]
MTKEFSRREFIQTLMAGVALGPAAFKTQKTSPGGLPTRLLGNTGERISIIGLGGWDAAANKSDEDSIRLIQEAVDNGITFFDNAWEYHRGHAEELMGKALAEGGRRDKIFLMTKICARDYEGAREHLHQCLTRLKTDRVDLLQFHSIQYEGDPQRVLDPDKGGLKAILEAKKEGKLRYIGFSGHMYPEMHLEMIKGHNWDSVQLPLNILDPHFKSFEKSVLPVLVGKKIGILGMKSLGAQGGRISRDTSISAELCRRYALSLPVSTLVCGIQTREELTADLAIARDFKPLTEVQIHELLDKTRGLATGGEIERYKHPQGGFGCSWHSRVLREEVK